VTTTCGKHYKRMASWRSQVPPKTRLLSELLQSRLTPVVEAAGFEWVDCELGQSDRPVAGSEVRFERITWDHIDVVYAFFDKYASPRFQIAFSRRARISPDRIIRSGRLVMSPSEHYHEWGKARWLPLALWSEARARRCVEEAVTRMTHVFRFLATDERGPGISRSVEMERPTATKGV